MRKWGLHLRLLRGDEGGEGLRAFFLDGGGIGTDERPARPRMTGDGHPYLRRGLKLKGGKFGRDERPARARSSVHSGE